MICIVGIVSEQVSRGDPERRRQVLEAALTTFARHGFRKASMDEIARHADISRPGLYFLFADKETLFREAMQQALDSALDAASSALEATSAPLGDRVVNGLDAWLGRFVGTSIDAGTAELLEHNTAQLGTMYSDYRTAFQGVLGRMLAREKIADARVARETAEFLHAAAIGWKHEVGTRDEFVAKLATAVRVLGFPCRAERRASRHHTD
jgi:TetR/AcrR family transcriptional regulator of autoinduction and epiphytic fitness